MLISQFGLNTASRRIPKNVTVIHNTALRLLEHIKPLQQKLHHKFTWTQSKPSNFAYIYPKLLKNPPFCLRILAKLTEINYNLPENTTYKTANLPWLIPASEISLGMANYVKSKNHVLIIISKITFKNSSLKSNSDFSLHRFIQNGRKNWRCRS